MASVRDGIPWDQVYVGDAPVIAPAGEAWEIHNVPFTSGATPLLPARGDYEDARNRRFSDFAALAGAHSSPWNNPALSVPDTEIDVNERFNITIMRPRAAGPSSRAILLLHGLNEKDWSKYLPWAHELVRRTGAAVVMFPIAFHVNRTRPEWAEPRAMQRVAAERARLLPGLAAASFVNAAVSTRLQAVPQRFFYSGLQTVHDLRAWIDGVRAGAEPRLARDCRLDVFAYSVGAFLAEILLLGDEDGRFADARTVLFCGGPTVDLMDPVSKFILDSEAHRALVGFLVAHLLEEEDDDPKLRRLVRPGTATTRAFELMVAWSRRRAERENALRSVADRVMAIALEQDRVAPPSAVRATLAPPGVPVTALDFDYAYRHENPFPRGTVAGDLVDRAFASVFDRVIDFLA